MENNLLVFAKMASDGISGLVNEIKKMPDNPNIPNDKRDELRNALKNSDLSKVEASIQDTIGRIRKIADIVNENKPK